MSSRLTNDTRHKMAQALVRHRFNDRANELLAQSAALFRAVLDERYDAQTKKIMRQLEKRVPGAFQTADTIYLRSLGMRVVVGAISVGTYKAGQWVGKGESRAILADAGQEPSAELAGRVADHALATQKFAEEVNQAYRTAKAALGQFSTHKRLSEEWPEALPVIQHLMVAEDRAVPVVQLVAINDEFGLPPAEAEQAA